MLKSYQLALATVLLLGCLTFETSSFARNLVGGHRRTNGTFTPAQHWSPPGYNNSRTQHGALNQRVFGPTYNPIQNRPVQHFQPWNHTQPQYGRFNQTPIAYYGNNAQHVGYYRRTNGTFTPPLNQKVYDPTYNPIQNRPVQHFQPWNHTQPQYGRFNQTPIAYNGNNAQHVGYYPPQVPQQAHIGFQPVQPSAPYGYNLTAPGNRTFIHGEQQFPARNRTFFNIVKLW